MILLLYFMTNEKEFMIRFIRRHGLREIRFKNPYNLILKYHDRLKNGLVIRPINNPSWALMG